MEKPDKHRVWGSTKLVKNRFRRKNNVGCIAVADNQQVESSEKNDKNNKFNNLLLLA
jgi:hypothetical protein